MKHIVKKIYLKYPKIKTLTIVRGAISDDLHVVDGLVKRHKKEPRLQECINIDSRCGTWEVL